MTGVQAVVAALFLFWGVILPLALGATALLDRWHAAALDARARRDRVTAADWQARP